MFCMHCGKEIPPDSTFCLRCGKQMWQGVSSYQATPVFTSPQPPANKSASKGAIAIIVVGGIILLTAFAIGIVKKAQTTSSSSYSSTPSQSYSSSRTIVSDNFAVGARMYVIYTIPGSGTVVGDFSAQGGANDINVMMLDDIGLQNFKNGHATRAYYNSGYVTADRLNVPLGSGTHYLVFDNTKAMLTNKVVTANIRLE
jgi:hypothetical protein